jgi:hypothetical protein
MKAVINRVKSEREDSGVREIHITLWRSQVLLPFTIVHITEHQPAANSHLKVFDLDIFPHHVRDLSRYPLFRPEYLYYRCPRRSAKWHALCLSSPLDPLLKPNNLRASCSAKTLRTADNTPHPPTWAAVRWQPQIVTTSTQTTSLTSLVRPATSPLTSTPPTSPTPLPSSLHLQPQPLSTHR